VSAAAVQPVPRQSLSRGVGRSVRDWVPAIAVFVLAVVAWQESIRVFHIKKFLLPKPTTIVTTFWHDRGMLWHAGWFTFQEALGGFAIGCALAILLAILLARFRALGVAFMPYAIAANAVPIVAFAPITNQWFSPLNKSSKMAVVAVLCFFPVLVNTLRGLTSVRPQSIELMRSYAAGEVEIFRRVRIPNSLPYLFSSLKVASVLAMIGAIVGEYFGGSLDSLGIQIKSDAALFAFDQAWAAIMVACVLGLLFYLSIALVERLTMGWQPPSRGAAE
jgi:NitT/TauT family transport system permease protein